MPIWSDNMTPEDHDRNQREIRQERLNAARELRHQAKAMLARADEIDAIYAPKD